MTYPQLNRDNQPEHRQPTRKTTVDTEQQRYGNAIVQAHRQHGNFDRLRLTLPTADQRKFEINENTINL